MHLPTLYGNEGGYMAGFYWNFNAISTINLNRKSNGLISKQEWGGLQSTFLIHGSSFSFDFLLL